MRKIVNYSTVLFLFLFGMTIGAALTTPGKSESHAILQKHGSYEALNGEYLIYTPDYTFLSIEEYEALAVISGLYEHVAVEDGINLNNSEDAK